ncbi:MAG: peptidoglycan-binding domain-containing protein [Oscillospiraceae bacterium]|nr:peptidoglycan-binding domain-containing protein [Oscillospiraceae bacterium]
MLLTYGSSGSDVSDLQTKLNSAGYGLSVDGIYGQKTQAAVRDYQSKNNLSVDGIAGDQTLGALSSATPSQTVIGGLSDDTAAGLSAAYQPSEAVRQAQADYEAALAVPAAAAPSDTDLQSIYDELQGRADFTYSLEDDPTYQQYKDQYERLGRSAMEDTMGQAAALTGGYGSTYAETAGQQQYSAYLQQLSDKVPDLYAAAQDRYDQEGDALQDRYSAAQEQYGVAYDRYRDAESDRQSAAETARKQLESTESLSYEEYQDLLDYYLQKAKLENSDYRWRQELLMG